MPSRAKRITRTTRYTLCLLLVGLSALGAAWLGRPSDVAATPPAAPAAGTSVAPPTPSAAPAASTAPSDAGVAQPTVSTDLNNATIIFATTPPATAMVTWGRKRLGKITPGKPLVVVRPRDSGPLDVMVRAADYLPVQTRAHTFSDNRVIVKLTPLANISELLGYRAPFDAGVEGGVPTAEQAAAISAMGASDGGVPQAVPTFQVVPTTTPAAQGPWLVP